MSRQAKHRLSPIAAGAFALAVTATPAHGEDKGVVFAGATAGKAPSAYLGGAVALPGSVLGRGPALRAVVARNDYRYDNGVARVKARQTVVTLSAVYQLSGDWGYANFAAGATHRNTRLTPDDRNNPNRGAKWNGVAGVDGAASFGRWRVGGSGSYEFDLGEYYGRLELTRTAARSLRLGAEVVAQGNPMYDRQLYGPVLSYQPSAKWEARISAGALVQRTQNSPYAALSLSRTF